jgi:hypothetical protein
VYVKNIGDEHVGQNKASMVWEKGKRFKEERSSEEGGEGQNVEEEYSEPVMCLQVVQWQM